LEDSQWFGESLAALGDLNGDGTNDIAVGAPEDAENGIPIGAVWVLFLDDNGKVKSHQKINDTQGEFTGALDNDSSFGSSVALLNDMDGDGVGELAVGDYTHDFKGSVWILFMQPDGTVKPDPNNPGESKHQRIAENEGGFTGLLNLNSLFGTSVTALGDLDGDGVDDLAVGAKWSNGGGFARGAVWVLLLNSDGTVKANTLIDDTNPTFFGTLQDQDFFGQSLAVVEDLDSGVSGTRALFVGAPQLSFLPQGSPQGTVWLLFLNPDGSVYSYKKVFQGVPFVFPGPKASIGISIATLGDLDGDGVTDIAVGSPLDDGGSPNNPNGNKGAVWILFLNVDGSIKEKKKIGYRKGGFKAPLDDGDRFGFSVAGIGDLDNDGQLDLAAGAIADDAGGIDRGAVYVLFSEHVGSLVDLDLKVDRVDITQSIQDDQGTVPLVADKQTMARVWVDWTGVQSEVTGVDATLRIWVDGVEPCNSPVLSEGAITAVRAPQESQENDSINFVFTVPESSDVDFLVSLNIPEIVPETNLLNNKSWVKDRVFECRRVPSIAYYLVDYRPTAPTGAQNIPSEEEVKGWSSFVPSGFPVPAVGYEPLGLMTTSIDVSTWGGMLLFNFILLWGYQDGLSPRPDFVVAYFPNNAVFPPSSVFPGGPVLANTTFTAISIRQPNLINSNQMERVLGHEVCHAFRFCHVEGLSPFCFNPPLEIGGIGVDVPPAFDDQTRMKPSTAKSFMSEKAGSQSWIGLYEYGIIMDDPLLECATGESPRPVVSKPGFSNTDLMVAGVYDPNSGTGSLLFVAYAPDSARTTNAPGGELLLKAYTNYPSAVVKGMPQGENLLYELRFNTSSSECTGPGCPEPFMLVIPGVSGTPPKAVDRIEIREAASGSLLVARKRSAGAPQVQLLTPGPGSTINNGEPVTWSWTDPDGDPVTFDLCYSWDGGQSMLPVAINTSGTTHLLDSTLLPGSGPGLAELHLTANDGFNSTSVSVVGLTQPNKQPPNLSIAVPGVGAVALAGMDIFLRAHANDPEEGPLSGSALEWWSDLDGLLGTGESLVTDGLSIGYHVITIIGTDSDSMTGQDSIVLQIADRPPQIASGDFDFDGVVGARDFAIFEICLSNSSTAFVCDYADLDDDGDVDCADWAVLRTLWTAPGTPLMTSLPMLDCNGNGKADLCDIAGGGSQDCNENGVPDECDITSGTSADLDQNGIPDECE
jgi:hypothetical protein